jgi:hypothetical protein
MQPNTAPPGLTGGVALELQELQGTNLLFCRQGAWKESSLWMKMRAELTQRVGVQDTFLAEDNSTGMWHRRSRWNGLFRRFSGRPMPACGRKQLDSANPIGSKILLNKVSWEITGGLA